MITLAIKVQRSVRTGVPRKDAVGLTPPSLKFPDNVVHLGIQGILLNIMPGHEDNRIVEGIV